MIIGFVLKCDFVQDKKHWVLGEYIVCGGTHLVGRCAASPTFVHNKETKILTSPSDSDELLSSLSSSSSDELFMDAACCPPCTPMFCCCRFNASGAPAAGAPAAGAPTAGAPAAGAPAAGA